MKKKALVLFIIIGALASVIAISFLIQYRENEDAYLIKYKSEQYEIMAIATTKYF